MEADHIDAPLPEPRLIQRSALVNRARRFVYLQVPKTACTTVVWRLWSVLHRLGEAAGPPVPAEIHRPGLALWDDDVSLVLDPSFFRFTVVRNPFARTLSAYLDKIRRRGDPNRRRFLELTGSPRGAEIGFRSFLETLQRPEILRSDRHWMPQNEAALFDFARIDVVARFERFEDDLSPVLERIFGAAAAGAKGDGSAHGTGAADRVAEFYTAVEVDLVRRLYARDFDVFGYSPDPDRLDAERPARAEESGSRALSREVAERLAETTRLKRRQASQRARKRSRRPA